MPELEVVIAVLGFGMTLLILILLAASIRIVREGEFMAVFRLGRAWKVFGPGLVAVIPLTDRTVRVSLPVGMVDLGAARDLRRMGKQPSDQDVPGHPRLRMREVCLRAAMIARQSQPRSRRATAEQFEEALRQVGSTEEPRAW